MGRRSHHPDPGTPHEFRQVNDPGIAAFAVGGGQAEMGFSAVTLVATTDNYIRKSRCGVPGCGRERSDPIHHGGEE